MDAFLELILKLENVQFLFHLIKKLVSTTRIK